ncbi:DNA dC-_dU-editing enzyme APOBEC-3C-like [Acipenser oxyrinchus oxyrinchus]|uniref:DNA dC->dU-editing enzyme APOBEC-3C-like n=1 Tax=Acipenser oxyrinchus oxyrinchus TaxID=40147 RepID=A0AAD8CEY4_ACIOX|nr:DNA dC->dU-editing enzyme APOBEC-3C-like [Acipenser oxyrinchus oxyrinchus]
MIASSDADSKTNSSHKRSSFIKMNRIPDDVFNFQFENLQLAHGRKRDVAVPDSERERGCAPQIITFVEKHANVKLNIFVSRLFRHDSEPHRKGLRALSQHERIGLKVMTLADFQDCFDRFVGEGNGFQNWEDLAGNSARYAAILEGITGAGSRLAF